MIALTKDDLKIIFGKGTLVLVGSMVVHTATGKKCAAMGIKESEESPLPLGAAPKKSVDFNLCEVKCIFTSTEAIDNLISHLQELKNSYQLDMAMEVNP